MCIFSACENRPGTPPGSLPARWRCASGSPTTVVHYCRGRDWTTTLRRRRSPAEDSASVWYLYYHTNGHKLLMTKQTTRWCLVLLRNRNGVCHRPMVASLLQVALNLGYCGRVLDSNKLAGFRTHQTRQDVNGSCLC